MKLPWSIFSARAGKMAKKSEAKKSDFPSLKSAEFSQAEADQASLAEIKKKWDKYSKGWPQHVRDTVLRLSKQVKKNPSNSKTPSSHAVWKDGKDGNYNFGHWVVLNAIYGNNDVSLIGLKMKLQQAFPNVNFERFSGTGLDDDDEDDDDDDGGKDGSVEEIGKEAWKKKDKKKKRPSDTMNSPVRSSPRFKKKKTDSVISSSSSESTESDRAVKQEKGKIDKRKSMIPRPPPSETYYSQQRQAMGGYAYSPHAYGGGNAFMSVTAPQAMGMPASMQQGLAPHTPNMAYGHRNMGQFPHEFETAAVIRLRHEMEGRLAAQERQHADEMQTLRTSFAQQLLSTKEELYKAINELANRTTSLEGRGDLGDLEG